MSEQVSFVLERGIRSTCDTLNDIFRKYKIPEDYISNYLGLDANEKIEFLMDAVLNGVNQAVEKLSNKDCLYDYCTKPMEKYGIYMNEEYIKMELSNMRNMGNRVIGTYICSNCHKDDVMVRSVQMARADEPETQFIKCNNCGKTWKS